MEQTNKYYAFITYSRNDQEWAKWLRKKLETFHLPDNIGESIPNLSRSLRPIFADVNDLVGESLSDVLQTSLENSRYLIVICSPESARSKWVDREVRTFIDLGRTEYIIPFIVDGNPYASDYDKECYPPSLLSISREKDILGVDVNAGGREVAFIKVACIMLGISFDSLWMRYKRDRRRHYWSLPFRVIATPFIYVRNLIIRANASSEIEVIDNYTPQKDNTDIFISYRRIDGRDVARTIEQALQKDHYQNIFFDYTSIQDGKFNLKIIDAIFSCKDFILVLSPLSMKKCSKKGDWVAREIRTALKYKSHIIPVVIENADGNTNWQWPSNFPKDMSEIKDFEQLPFQMGTYFPAAMRNLMGRLNTGRSETKKDLISEDKDIVNLKIKSPVPCEVYIDDELYDSITETNKLIKIPLRKGEYLINISTLDGNTVLLEEKIDLIRDKLYTSFELNK